MKKIVLGTLVIAIVLSAIVFANLTSESRYPESRQPYKYFPTFESRFVNLTTTVLILAVLAFGGVFAIIGGVVLLVQGFEDRARLRRFRDPS